MNINKSSPYHINMFAEQLNKFINEIKNNVSNENTNLILSCSFCDEKISVSQMSSHFEKVHNFAFSTFQSNICMLTESAKILFPKINNLHIFFESMLSFIVNSENFNDLLQIKTFFLSCRMALENICVSLLAFYGINIIDNDSLEEVISKLKLVVYPPSNLNSFFSLKSLIGKNVHDFSKNKCLFDLELADSIAMNFRMVIKTTISLFADKGNQIRSNIFYGISSKERDSPIRKMNRESSPIRERKIDRQSPSRRERKIDRQSKSRERKIDRESPSRTKKNSEKEIDCETEFSSKILDKINNGLSSKRKIEENKVYLSKENKKRKINKIGDYHKIKLCRHWELKGECPKGKHCKFAHGQEEIRKSICMYYLQGTCNNTTNCPFLHKNS